MSSTLTTPKLFQPIKIGNLTLKHRVVLAPLTRLRASPAPELTPLPGLVKEYYTQRAKVPGTLLIAEGTCISPQASGLPSLPGIWSEKQIAAWKEIVDAVHAEGSFIFLQIAAFGRAAMLPILQSLDPSFEVLSASSIPLSSPGASIPRAMTPAEITATVQSFATAAGNAVHKAGFDGVEIHGSSGLLVDQFLQEESNVREDRYGGRVENRARFALEVLEAVTKEVGEERTGLRVGAWGTSLFMGMADPIPTFTYLISQLKSRHPNFAYLHVVEPRVDGMVEKDPSTIPPHQSNDFIRQLWVSKPLISAGGYGRELAIKTAEEKGDVIAFGRHFIANPDLPKRLKEDIALTPYDRSTFYLPADASGKGYTDYPFA